MSEQQRQGGGRKGARNAANDTLLALYDSLEDLYSILETLDELGIRTRDELVAYIDTLDAEIEDLEALDNR